MAHEIGTAEPAEEAREWSGPSAFSALKHRDYLIYWSGLAVSATGSWMQAVAQGWLVYQLTHSSKYLGFVGAAGTAPVLLLALHGGVIADRFNKRKIVLITQTSALVLAGLLAALAYSPHIRAWNIIVFAALMGIVNAIDIPARQAITTEIVGKADLPNAVAWNSFAFNGARIIGPSVAGLILKFSGPATCFLINSISYAAVLIGLLLVGGAKFRTGASNGSVTGEIVEGLRYSVKNKLIRDILVLTAAASIFVLQYTTQLPALAQRVLGVGKLGYSMMVTAAGVGAVTAAICVAVFGHRFSRGRTVIAGTLLLPAAVAGLSFSRHYAISLGYLAIIGFSMMLFLAVSNSIIQLASPDEMRGRMLSVRTLLFMGLAPLGSLQIGYLADSLGVQYGFRVGACVCAAVAIYYALRSRAIRSFK